MDKDDCCISDQRVSLMTQCLLYRLHQARSKLSENIRDVCPERK